MQLKNNVYLVGMMGAGKTTIGRKLAKSLAREFTDLDRHIENDTGVSVTTIFEIEGEAGFRQRESQALDQLAMQKGVVVATGGGVVLDPVNRVRLQASGIVVYLHAPAHLLYARTRHDRGRPLLQVSDPLARIASLVEKRDPLYREVADLVVESAQGPGAATQVIIRYLEEKQWLC